MTIPTDIENLVLQSGNSFHSKVACWLTENEWHVTVSPYYTDYATNKSREIDLVAEKSCGYEDIIGNERGVIIIRLFVECKYVPSPTVFWFAEKDRASALDLVCKKPLLNPNNIHTEKHHYLAHSSQVAKLFLTKGKQSGENDPFFKALNQSLNAMVYLRGKKTPIPKFRESRPKVLEVLEFPVIVCNSFENFYQVPFGGAEDSPKISKISKFFQLEVNYAYLSSSGSRRNEYFLIDIVSFELLNEFEQALQEGLQAFPVRISEA